MLQSSLLKIGADITSESSLGERALTGLQVMLIGMGVVFGVLLLLMGILYIFKLFAVKSAKKQSVEPAVSSQAAALSQTPASDEETVVAAATAAIAAARGESDCAFNVISIRKIVK